MKFETEYLLHEFRKEQLYLFAEDGCAYRMLAHQEPMSRMLALINALESELIPKSISNQQLQLTPDELIKIGFSKREYPAVSISDENSFGSVAKTTYEIPCINGCFFCNMHESVYVWYHKTVIDESANYICLNIVGVPELYLILTAFKVKYNMIII